MTAWVGFSYIFVLCVVAEPIDYYQYTAAQFFGLDEVNREIDLQDFNMELMEAAIFFASNEVRVANDRKIFQQNNKLHKAARFHATYLEDKKLVSHLNRSGKRYHTPFKRSEAFGGRFTAVAENLARLSVYRLGKNGEFFVTEEGRLVDKSGNPLKKYTYAQLAREVLKGWMDSEGHRENLMADFGMLGVGVSGISVNDVGIPEVYMVQNFANP